MSELTTGEIIQQSLDMAGSTVLGTRLKALRLQAGLTQLDLQLSVEVSQTLLSRYEKGRSYPSIPTLEKLCRFYGVTATDLLGF